MFKSVYSSTSHSVSKDLPVKKKKEKNPLLVKNYQNRIFLERKKIKEKVIKLNFHLTLGNIVLSEISLFSL